MRQSDDDEGVLCVAVSQAKREWFLRFWENYVAVYFPASWMKQKNWEKNQRDARINHFSLYRTKNEHN